MFHNCLLSDGLVATILSLPSAVEATLKPGYPIGWIEYSPLDKRKTRNSAGERDLGLSVIWVPILGGDAWCHSFPTALLKMLTLKPGGPPNAGLQVPRVFRGVADVSARKERARDIIEESIMTTKTRKLNVSGKCGGDNGGSLNEWPGTYIPRRGGVTRNDFGVE